MTFDVCSLYIAINERKNLDYKINDSLETGQLTFFALIVIYSWILEIIKKRF